MKENEHMIKPADKNEGKMIDLNAFAKHAYEVCKKRGKDSDDILDFLKYLAGETVEATEAYKIIAGDFALELADVIMTCLIIMHKCGMDARRALFGCHIKNMEKLRKGE